MKKVLFFLCSFSILLSAQNFNWTWQNSYPQGNNLNDAVIVSGTRYICAGDKSVMMLSTNAGATWSLSYPDSTTGMRDIYELSFVNANIGFACGTNGLLMKTTNGGNSWNVITSPAPATLWYVHFIDADTGYICGNTSTFFKTVDGGTNWIQIPLSASTTLYKVYFLNPRIGYLGTAAASPGRLLKTTDYGATWNNVAGYTATGTVRGIYFLDENTGFVTDQNYAISKTTDGGLTWNTQDLGTGTFYEIKFFDANNGVAAGATGQVYVTTDAGTNWTLTDIGFSPTSNVYGLALEGNLGDDPAISNILVAGEAGVIAKSSNLGTTWTPLVSSPARGDFRQIEFVSPNVAFASGGTTSVPASSTVLKTTNGGQTWIKLPFDGGYQLYSHDWINENIGYVARRGPDGIFKTTDGGATFTQLNPGVATATAIWYCMGFGNADTGYAGNGSGQLVRTTDGGATWTALSSPYGTSPIYDIYVFDAKTIVTAGGSCKIFKTTDAGNTWITLTPTGITTTLYGVYFPSPMIGYVTGVSGKCYRTTDGGSSWMDSPTGTTTTFYHVIFASTTKGWLSGTTGGVLYTTNGGESWNPATKFPSNTTIYGGSINGQNLYFSGGRGNIIKGFADPLSVPVELTSFTAAVNGNNILLNWQTATEVNNRGFYIERKLNNSGYETVTFISGKGNSVTQINYSFTDKNITSGSYTYRLKQVDFDGTSKYSKEVDVEFNGEFTYRLEQNYPNPFNPATVIQYSIPRNEIIQLSLYNILGEKVKELYKGFQTAGSYSINLNAAELSSGIYMYKLETPNYSQSRKLILLK